MKDYIVKNIDTGKITKITTVNLLGLRMRLEIDNQSAGLSQYERVDDETRFIYLPNKKYMGKITFQIMSCCPHEPLEGKIKKVGAPFGSTNARKGEETMVNSLYGMRLPKEQDRELRDRLAKSGLTHKEFLLKALNIEAYK